MSYEKLIDEIQNEDEEYVRKLDPVQRDILFKGMFLEALTYSVKNIKCIVQNLNIHCFFLLLVVHDKILLHSK